MKRIKKRLNAHKRWLKEPGPYILSSNLEEYEAFRDQHEVALADLRSLKISLDGLSAFHGTKFVVDVWNESYIATDVARAAFYRYWSLVINFEIFFNQERLGVRSLDLTYECRTFANLACLFFATGQQEKAIHCARMLHTISTSADALAPNYWETAEFEPYALKLFETFVGNGDSQGTLGVYEDHCNVDSLSSPQIEQLCEHHLEYMVETYTRQWDYPFEVAPFDLIPWEILAIKRHCEVNSHEFPDTSHPLLSDEVSNLTKLQMPDYRDDGIDKIEQSVSHCLG